MGKLLAAIKHFVTNVGVFVSDTFVKIFGQDAAHTFAVAAESVLNSDLGKIAWTAVQEAENLATGVDKKAAAFANIVAAAKTDGIEAKDSIVNMLIEMAVQKVKGQFGPAPAE